MAAGLLLEAIERQLDAEGAATVIWSGGNSPRTLLPDLAVSNVDWSRVTFLMSDERWVPLDSPLSNEGEMRRYVTGTPLSAAAIVGLYLPESSRHGAVERLHERVAPLVRMPPCFALLGMGEDGHTASLFPEVGWSETANRFVMATTGPAENVAERISLTPAALLAASQIGLICNSPGKRAVWARIQDGASVERYPAAIFSRRPSGTFFLVS